MSKSLNDKQDTAPHELGSAERDLLLADSSGVPPAPDRGRMLNAAYAADQHRNQENEMTPTLITRLFAGRNPVMRLALGALCLVAVFALSLMLPRGGGISPVAPAWASADGYLLAFDFGEGSTEEQVRPVLQQLQEAVSAFKAANGIPVEKSTRIGSFGERKVVKKIERHGEGPGTESEATEEKSRVIVMVSLPDASKLDALEAALASIPGLPAPTRTNATWFTEQGLPDPDKPGINLALNFGEGENSAPHMFYFPETATEGEIEASINEWLAANHPGKKFEVDVTLTRTDGRIELGVQINNRDSVETVEHRGPASESGKPGINLALSFGGEQKTFNFPMDATEAQIEAEISEWLAAAQPDSKLSVDVTLTRDGSRTDVDVKVGDSSAVETVNIAGPTG